MNIIIIGPPGAGKGTQARKLAKELNLHVISSGRLLRDEAKKATKTGIEIKKYVDKGNLVPDSIFLKILNNAINNRKRLIIDGVPRSRSQLKFPFCKKPDYVFLIDVPKKELMRRIILRTGKNSRNDDKSIIALQNRFYKYVNNIEYIKKYYKKNGSLFLIDGNQTKNKVFRDIMNIIKRKTN
ncbi:nucleoside monophosphate kinase [Candidatus Woesearchaeota archaeon]|nr:nucleoside monophosphate kinase [Candidatus Woesearchaeota archaeon]